MSEQNDAYFYGQARNYLATQDDDSLVTRLTELKGISDAFGTSAWSTLLRDSSMWKDQMDSRWQDVTDEKVLMPMRVVKQAYNFIQGIPDRYKKEVELLEEELKSRELHRDITEEQE